MFARDRVIDSERRATVLPLPSSRGSHSTSSCRKIVNPMEPSISQAYDRPVPAVVVGRDAELASIRDFVAGIGGGASALVLEGEAGMGKTTLWRAGVEAAEAAGARVLQAEPAESETALSFSGLGDLLDPVLDEALAPLPAAQRSALARALLLEEVEGPPPDSHAAGVALLNAFRGLCGAREVLIAVDDVQWLDAASAAAFAYSARRLREERVGVLLARRSGLDSSLVDDLRRTGRGMDVRVEALDVASLHKVVQAHLDIALPRPLLAEVHQASGGNPFFALEIVRTLGRSGVSVEAGRPLPVPDSLHDLVHGRLLALPPASRDFLAAAAAHARPTIAITEDASGVERAVGLTPALEARVVVTHGDDIRFTHPLLAAGVLETVEPRRRAEIHARLAELLEDPEARAWQLAASVEGADETIAAVIEAAADHARGRGAPRPAALLLDCAEQLTPGVNREDRVRRAVEAAYLHFEAGDARRAEAKLDQIIAPLEPGPLRARALVVLARVRLYERPHEAKALFLQVIDEAGDDRQTLGIAHEGAAACSVWIFEDFHEALEHTRLALDLATELGDDALAADTILTQLGAETLLGHSAATATGERALALQHAAENLRVMDHPLISLTECWTWTDEHQRAREGLVQLMQRAADHGDENARPWLLFLLAEVEVIGGNLDTAAEMTREGQEVAAQSGQPLFQWLHLALESFVLAQLGQVEAAQQAARRAMDVGTDRFVELVGSAALAHLALSRSAPGEVVVELEPRIAFVRKQGIVEPGAARFIPDQAEALIELGRREDAVELLVWYEENARRLGRVSALANCARCRGLLAAQDGDLEAAVTAFEEALEWHARVEIPLDRGRTLLALGATQRRLKRRREARATLEEALALFERIGAALWAERARADLKRISGRAATPGALTPAEERVAALVAEGKTNREVAAALFLSERTVEGHLSRVFGKLGLRHRSELASALAPSQTQGAPSSNTGGSPVSAESSAP
jgi:DNA-binding CsgD family transcriptional regulator